MKKILCLAMLPLALSGCKVKIENSYLIEIHDKYGYILHSEYHEAKSNMYIQKTCDIDTLKRKDFTFYCGKCISKDQIHLIEIICRTNQRNIDNKMDYDNYDSRDDLYDEYGNPKY